MSLNVSEDSEDSSDISSDSLDFDPKCYSAFRVDSNITPSDLRDKNEAEDMDLDIRLPSDEEISENEAFLSARQGTNNSFSAVSEYQIQQLNSECGSVKSNIDDLSYDLSHLTLQKNSTINSARSDSRLDNRISTRFGASKSFTSLRNICRQKSKSVSPASTKKFAVAPCSRHSSYLEQYRRRKFGAKAVAQSSSPTEIAEGQENGGIANKLDQRNTLLCDFINYPSGSCVDVDIKDIKFPPKDLQQLCEKEKGQNSDSYDFNWFQKLDETEPTAMQCSNRGATRNCVKNSKHSSSTRIARLTYDFKAAQEKYDRMKKQRYYGEQASIRNRVKLQQKRRTNSIDNQRHTDSEISNRSPEKAKHLKNNMTTTQNIETKMAVKGKRRSSSLSKRNSRKTSGNFSHNTPSVLADLMRPVQPLVERHLKEVEIVENIRRSFKPT